MELSSGDKPLIFESYNQMAFTRRDFTMRFNISGSQDRKAAYQRQLKKTKRFIMKGSYEKSHYKNQKENNQEAPSLRENTKLWQYIYASHVAHPQPLIPVSTIQCQNHPRLKEKELVTTNKTARLLPETHAYTEIRHTPSSHEGIWLHHGCCASGLICNQGCAGNHSSTDLVTCTCSRISHNYRAEDKFRGISSDFFSHSYKP